MTDSQMTEQEDHPTALKKRRVQLDFGYGYQSGGEVLMASILTYRNACRRGM